MSDRTQQLVCSEARSAIAAAMRARRIEDEADAVAALEEIYAELRVIAIDERLRARPANWAADVRCAATTPVSRRHRRLW